MVAVLWHTSKVGSYVAKLSSPILPSHLHDEKRVRTRASLRAFLCNPIRCFTIALTVFLSFLTTTLLLHDARLFAELQSHIFGAPSPPTPTTSTSDEIDHLNGVVSLELPSPHPVRLPGSDVVYDAYYAPSPAQAIADPRIRPMRAHDAIPYSCLEHWVSSGIWESPCEDGMVQESEISLVYVWVNGSDPLHEASRASLLAASGYNTKAARFREHDELRYSLRAALGATRWWPNTTWHLVTADVKAPEDERSQTMLASPSQTDAEREQRLGLVPQWLDMQCALETDRMVQINETHRLRQPPIILHHDTQLFRYSDDPGKVLQADDAAQWLAKVIPSFNSHAIESQLANLPTELVSDQIVAMNDDQFLTMITPPAAFHTTLYGPVFRMDAGLLVGGDNTGAGDGGGEWRSIPWSGHLLDERFGKRKRPYMKHISRSLSLPLLHESLLAFGKPYAATPLSQFRGEHFADREWEINTIFLATHFIIERHREALLWSWVVGKWGQKSHVKGLLDTATKRLMWRELGGEGDTNIVRKGTASRTAMSNLDKNMRAMGVRTPGAPYRSGVMDTKYSWVSMNGYSPSWTRLVDRINLRHECMGPASESAWEMFRRLALEDLACADQMMGSLMYSAPSGLEVFLPAPSEAPSPANEPIILPLVLPESESFFPKNPRTFAVRLIQRYTYSIGRSPMHFIGPTTASRARSDLRTAERLDMGLLCINDDLPNGDTPREQKEAEEGDRLLREFFRKKWPQKMACELD